MSWPRWIDELKERYLADEANVFVVDGITDDRRWTVDGESLDAVKILVRFLRRTREVVGVLRPAPPPSRLEFADFTDRTRFENLVKAAAVLGGTAQALAENEPEQALGRIWQALGTAGTAQGWIVTDTERLVPAARKRVEPIPGAPALFAWARHPALRRSNNLVVFLASDASAVRAELLDGAGLVHARPGAAPTPAPDEVSTEESSADAPSPRARADEALREDLERALVDALVSWPEESRAARLPVMDAVARVLASHRPDRFAEVQLSTDAEGVVVAGGAGGDVFLAAWKGDVALDAAAAMLLKGVSGAFTASSPPPLDATATGALTRRVERLLR